MLGDVDLRSASTENRITVAVLDNVTKASGVVTLDVTAPDTASKKR